MDKCLGEYKSENCVVGLYGLRQVIFEWWVAPFHFPWSVSNHVLMLHTMYTTCMVSGALPYSSQGLHPTLPFALISPALNPVSVSVPWKTHSSAWGNGYCSRAHPSFSMDGAIFCIVTLQTMWSPIWPSCNQMTSPFMLWFNMRAQPQTLVLLIPN